jgi:hypothetical protein
VTPTIDVSSPKKDLISFFTQIPKKIMLIPSLHFQQNMPTNILDEALNEAESFVDEQLQQQQQQKQQQKEVVVTPAEAAEANNRGGSQPVSRKRAGGDIDEGDDVVGKKVDYFGFTQHVQHVLMFLEDGLGEQFARAKGGRGGGRRDEDGGKRRVGGRVPD